MTLPSPRVSVLVPTYRRPADLARCLAGLRAQTRAADEIVVVARGDDAGTLALLQSQSAMTARLRSVCVDRPGVIAAMNAGLAVVTGDVIALTDDDCVPRADWLAKIEATFAAWPGAVAVGGRDWQHYGEVTFDDSRSRVGVVQWFGRVIHNHHLGVGPARAVDILKGANAAFRAGLLKEIGFDKSLAGPGAQVHWEMSLCLRLRRGGGVIVYDPAIEVDHYPSVRHDADQNNRGGFAAGPHIDATRNEASVLARHLPLGRRLAWLTWATLIGTRSSPGLLALMAGIRNNPRQALARWRATRRGRRLGLAFAKSAARRSVPGGSP